MRFKIKAEEPTTPKPTTTLPDNMTWAWDPKANQWIAVMKDNPVVTPPTYNPNNITNTSNYTSTNYVSNIKSTLIDSLNQFLDGDRYSREIKIEKGLISDGLVRLAGINPIKGPKYSITKKGLNLLKQAAQEEHNLEKDYVDAKKSYLLDGITESEFKTGAPETQGKMPKFSIFEKDGSELAQIEAKNSTDAKVKFIMEHPEYEGSQTIEVKEIDSAYGETTTQGLDFPNKSVSPSTDIKVDPKGWVNMASENEDKKKSIIKTIVYKKNNQYPNSVNLSLDLDNKAIVTGDFQILSEIEDELRDYGIISSIEPQMEDVYKLTVLFSPKGSPTDKFASMKKKASEPFKFKAPKDIFTTIKNGFLVKLASQKLGVELDPSRFEFDYVLNYELNSEINWGIDFETRDYGIKNMRIYVPDQTISMKVEYIPHRENAPIKEKKIIDIECSLKNVESEMGQKYEYDSIELKKIEIAEDYCKATF